MDPMTLLEEERRLKEETELREYSETVVIDESSFFANRDLTGKGKDVHPSGKQRKIVNTIAETLIIRKPPKWRVSSADLSGGFDDSQDYYDENSVKDFDLTLKPRIFITSGPISKREPDKMLWRVSKRVLFLFNDVLLLTTKKEKEANDIFEVQQILWVKDLRLKHLQPDTPEDNLAFEIVINKTRNRPKSSIYLSCDNEDAKKQLDSRVGECIARLSSRNRAVVVHGLVPRDHPGHLSLGSLLGRPRAAAEAPQHALRPPQQWQQQQ